MGGSWSLEVPRSRISLPFSPVMRGLRVSPRRLVGEAGPGPGVWYSHVTRAATQNRGSKTARHVTRASTQIQRRVTRATRLATIPRHVTRASPRDSTSRDQRAYKDAASRDTRASTEREGAAGREERRRCEGVTAAVRHILGDKKPGPASVCYAPTPTPHYAPTPTPAYAPTRRAVCRLVLTGGVWCYQGARGRGV